MNNRDDFRKWEKYLVAFKIAGRKYYTVWGTDLSSENEDDKFLCNFENNIICFTSVKQIQTELLNLKSFFFDKKNLFDFAQRIAVLKSNKLKVYTIDLDFLHKQLNEMSFSESFLSEEKFFSVFVDFFNLAGDYVSQVKYSEINNNLSFKGFLTFWEHFYDYFLWKDSNYDYKNSNIKKTILSKDKMVLKFELLLLNFSSRLTFFN